MSVRTKPLHDSFTLAPRVDRDDRAGSAHLVQFYENEPSLIDAVIRFVTAGLEVNDAVVLLATDAHRAGIEEQCRARGVDFATVREQGQYLALDATRTLTQVIVHGWPDEQRFADIVGATIARSAANGRHVRAFGEMVCLLWADGKPEAAIRLEQLWDRLVRTVPLTLLCGYPMSCFRRGADVERFLEVCEAHSHVIPAESYSALTSPEERLRTISLLQQKANALETETKERQQAEKSLHRHKKDLADFVENALEGLHQVGADGRVLWANRALLDLLGYTTEEYVGHHLSEFHVHREVFDHFWHRLMCHDTLYDYPAKLRSKDGSTKCVVIHSSGLWENGQFLYTRCFIRDVTERQQLEDALKAKIEQLAELDRRKDEFLAMLGHELRNPLSAVQNALATACRDATQRDRALEIAQRQANQLGRLVDDLLDVARVTQGRITLKKENVHLHWIIERAIDATRSIVESSRHVLTVSLSPDDIWVTADPVRLEQVVVNLLVNAAKYTQLGGQIGVAVERRGDHAVFSVRDSGLGIGPEMLPRIFDLFMQGERSLDRAQGGLGLGLHFARRVVELHGGEIEAHSDGIGRGAKFVVRIPAVPAPAEEKPTIRGTGSAPRQGVRMIVVEDNPDAAESLAMLLELLGHHVRVVHDGAAAIDLAHAETPDIMLVDIGLPRMNGYEVARRIRLNPDFTGIVLVALTGYAHDEDRQNAFAAGFNHHLVKPLDVAKLQELVARIPFRTGDPQDIHPRNDLQ